MNKITQYILAALGFLVAMVAYGKSKQMQGAKIAKDEYHFDDMSNALKIREDAQNDLSKIKAHVDALSAKSVDDGLRDKGKLRD